MIPDIQRTFIQIITGWRAAVPEKVESEIVEPQEDRGKWQIPVAGSQLERSTVAVCVCRLITTVTVANASVIIRVN